MGIWLKAFREGNQLLVTWDGEQRRDFTHVDDIVDALYKIGISNEKHEDAWELGTGMNYSINEVYQMFKEKFGCDRWHVKDQPGNYRKTLRVNDDTLDRLGWKPSDKLAEYIKSL